MLLMASMFTPSQALTVKDVKNIWTYELFVTRGRIERKCELCFREALLSHFSGEEESGTGSRKHARRSVRVRQVLSIFVESNKKIQEMQGDPGGCVHVWVALEL